MDDLVGETACDPLAATGPMPSIEVAVALVVVHVKVADWPRSIACGLAPKVAVGAGAGAGAGGGGGGGGGGAATFL